MPKQSQPGRRQWACAGVVSGRSAFAAWLENISLEFDFAMLDRSPPIPGVFLGFLHRSDDLNGLSREEINARGMEAVYRGLNMLREAELPAAMQEQVWRCFGGRCRITPLFFKPA